MFIDRALSFVVLGCLVAGAAGCRGELGDAAPWRPDSERGGRFAGPVHTELRASGPEPATRLLTQPELEASLNALLADDGRGPVELGALPPIGTHEHAFARVAESQTPSLSLLEQLAPSLEIAARRLSTTESMARLGGDACPADRLPAEGFVVEARDVDAIYRWDDPLAFEMLVGVPAPGELVARVEYDGRTGTTHTLLVDGVAAATHACETRPCVWEHRWLESAAGPRLLRLEVTTGGRQPQLASFRVSSPIPEDALSPAEARACARRFVGGLATRAWRRPVTGVEEEALLGVFDAVRPQGFATASAAAAEAILSSPHFLHLVQLGAEGELGSYEIASRLGYAFCSAPPDARLLADAESGALLDPEVRGEHARRLLDECGRPTVRRFFHQWLELDRVATFSADPTHFPDFVPEAPVAALTQADAFFERLVFEREASFDALHEEEADPSALPAGLYGDARFAGLLALPAVAMATSKPYGTSPVRRGVFVLERLLCAELAPPPIDVATDVPLADETATTRERWASHSEHDACRGCHDQIDPVGFLLEDRDPLGRLRMLEHGLPVDARGGVPLLGVPDGALNGSAQLSRELASSPRARECFARHWVRHALGRVEHEGDAEGIALVAERAGTESLREAMVEVTRWSGFTRRRQQ